MEFQKLPLPDYFKKHYAKFSQLSPIQEKAVHAGLLEGSSILACAPTASGKTLIATMAICNVLDKRLLDKRWLDKESRLLDKESQISSKVELSDKGKALYVVPLKALAKEKYEEFHRLLEGTNHKVILSTGDIDSESAYLASYDLLILTTEKLDSLLRHKVSWLGEVKVVIIDEIHLLNDPARGPTLEIVITLLKMLVNPQLIGLSATIGNPQELAKWLEAKLITDNWRPVELKKGIHCRDETEFY
ncbi:MAG: DEAD/DEAH box helicase [Nanoarchaeota archaeon]